MTHAFLSNDWMDAARGIREKYSDQVPEIPTVIKINLSIIDVPFDDHTINAFFDTSSGGLRLELGELDDADATITTDYETAHVIQMKTWTWGNHGKQQRTRPLLELKLKLKLMKVVQES